MRPKALKDIIEKSPILVYLFLEFPMLRLLEISS